MPLAGRLKSSFLGLQCKSTLLVATLTLCVAGVVGGLFFHFSGRLAARLQEEHSIHLCAVLARLAAVPVANGERDRLTELAREFATGDPLLFVAFCDAEGNPLASASASGAPLDWRSLRLKADDRQIVGRPVLRRSRAGTPTFLDVSYPISRAARPPSGEDRGDAGATPRSSLLGYARMGFNLDPMLKEFAGVMDLVSGIGLVVVLITIPLAFLVVRRIVVPLNELSRTADRLANGDLSARSTVHRTDEVGQLARSFNRMAEEIDRHESRITALNADLEARVRQRTRRLREMAARDPLTGLYNRRHFDEVLARSFSEARRYQNPLSCLMIDLDDFKDVNDRFGHHAGDRALILAAGTIASQLRASDVAARFGGDEFIVLLPHTDNEQAQSLSRRIVEAFALYADRELPHLDPGLSIGIASLSDTLADVPEALVRAADRALYHAKQEGKNRIEICRTPL